jgi:predicted nucleic acid-binding protein
MKRAEPDRIYLDSSVVVPYYRREATSVAVGALLDGREGPAFISELTDVEVASALSRLVRMGQLDAADAARIDVTFDQHLRAGRYVCNALAPHHYATARAWLRARIAPLRTLDALHAACAASLDAELVTADVRLGPACVALGVRHRVLTA